MLGQLTDSYSSNWMLKSRMSAVGNTKLWLYEFDCKSFIWNRFENKKVVAKRACLEAIEHPLLPPAFLDSTILSRAIQWGSLSTTCEESKIDSTWPVEPIAKVPSILISRKCYRHPPTVSWPPLYRLSRCLRIILMTSVRTRNDRVSTGPFTGRSFPQLKRHTTGAFILNLGSQRVLGPIMHIIHRILQTQPSACTPQRFEEARE